MTIKPYTLGPIKGSFPSICAECGADARIAGSCDHIKPGAKVVFFPGVLNLVGTVENMSTVFHIGEVTPRPFRKPVASTLIKYLSKPSTGES